MFINKYFTEFVKSFIELKSSLNRKLKIFVARKKYRWNRQQIQGGARAPHPPLHCFLQPLFFCNHFEELQTVLFEVELMINNAPFTYVYPNTIETCLTPNHLLLCRQLLYSFNTTSTAVRNLTVLSSTTDKINRISNHFWDRWRHEYVVNLRETQRISKLNIKRGKGTQTLLENCH